MEEEYENWLKTLKVGDKVAHLHRVYGQTDYSIGRIEKITPTRQIKLEGYATKFKNGEMIDTSVWKTTTNKIVPIDDKVKESIERTRLTRFLKNVEFDKLNLQQLRDIRKIVEGFKND